MTQGSEYGPGRPIVVLEGPDGSGKTTLANALVDAGYEYDHCGPPEKSALYYYLDGINRHPGKPLVIDRLHAGSYVYGKAFRGLDDLTDFERWILDGTIMSRQGVCVYAKPPFEATQKNLERGPDNADAAIYEDPAKRQAVRDLYDQYFDPASGLNGLWTIPYDYTQPGAFDELSATLARLPEFSYPTPVDSVPALGNTVYPKLVLVGDQPSGYTKIVKRMRQRAGEGWTVNQCERFLELASQPWLWEPPFVSQSGRYLHLALTASKVPLSDVCIFDATHWDGRRVSNFLDRKSNYWRLWEDEARFVALGKNADEELTLAGIEHDTVPHPSWWMRTNYKDCRGYGKLLKGG